MPLAGVRLALCEPPVSLLLEREPRVDLQKVQEVLALLAQPLGEGVDQGGDALSERLLLLPGVGGGLLGRYASFGAFGRLPMVLGAVKVSGASFGGAMGVVVAMLLLGGELLGLLLQVLHAGGVEGCDARLVVEGALVDVGLVPFALVRPPVAAAFHLVLPLVYCTAQSAGLIVCTNDKRTR